MATLVDKAAIDAAIRDAGGNITKAARKLGVARRTLQNRMRFYGMPVGQSGRQKRKITYGRGARNYALGGAALVIGGVLLLGRNKTKA